jgi:small-conductance mechanosensitive channel
MVMLRFVAILLLGWLLLPPEADAIWPFSQKSSKPAETAPAEPAPPASSIPAPEVVQRAEEATKVLRDLDTLLTPGPGISSIQARLPDLNDRMTALERETDELVGDPTAASIDFVSAQWRAVRAEVATYVNVLAERATALEHGLTRLTGLRDAWTQARTDARGSRAPAPVIDRIDGILRRVSDTRARLQEERAATLVLQDHVAQLVSRADVGLTRLVDARDDLAGRLLVQNGVPLWQPRSLARAFAEFPDRVDQAVDGAVSQFRQFTHDQQPRIYANLLLLALLTVVTFRARGAARRLAVPVDAGGPAVHALDRAFAAAALLTLLTNIFATPRSRVMQALAEVLALLAAVAVVRVGIEPRRRREFVVLAVLLFVDLVRRLTYAVPLLEQTIFLVEMLAMIAAVGWKLWAWQRSNTAPATRWQSALRYAAVTALVGFAGAAVATAAGYVRFGLFLGSGVIGIVYAAVVLHAALQVGRAFVAVALWSPPLRDLRVVRLHRKLLESRIVGVLRWLAAGAWIVLVLRHFSLAGAAGAFAADVLGAEFQRGALSVSLGGILAFVLIVVATFALSSVVRFLLQEAIYPSLVPHRTLPYAVSTLVHYSLVLAGFLLGLAAVGVDLTKITIVASALGLGIGFGLQGLVNNFVSGLVLLYERRINVGDAVQIGDLGGRVEQIGLRASMVRTWEGAEVIVPNASLTTERVTNWTLSDGLRRIDFPVGVAYGTAPEKVAEVLLRVARANPYVIADPAPVVLFLGFGDSALRFELRVWTAQFDRWVETRSELAVAGCAALGEAAIEIPFPQHEVRLRRG